MPVLTFAAMPFSAMAELHALAVVGATRDYEQLIAVAKNLITIASAAALIRRWT